LPGFWLCLLCLSGLGLILPILCRRPKPRVIRHAIQEPATGRHRTKRECTSCHIAYKTSRRRRQGSGRAQLTIHRFQHLGQNHCVRFLSSRGSGRRQRRQSSMLTEAWRGWSRAGDK
jgi:hypothetical protein